MRGSATAWLLIALAACVPLPAKTATQDTPIPRLIEQLGDPSFSQRKAATLQLERYGLRAFDDLWAARDSADAEVSAACERLLRAATRRWQRPSDPPVVRALLREYEERRDEDNRIAVLEELRRTDSTAALCRIARFEPSVRLSKEAAAQLLVEREWRPELDRQTSLAEALGDLRAAFGPSERLAVSWLWLSAGAGPAAEVSPRDAAEWWRQVAAAERQAADAGSVETSRTIQQQLVLWQLRASLEAGDEGLAMLAARHHVGLTDDAESALRLALPLRWIAEAGAAELASDVLEAFDEELSDRRGQYLKARTLSRLGKDSDADAAIGVALATGEASTRIARWLRRDGFDDWAEREVAAAGAVIDPLSLEVINARWLLFNWQLDAAEYRQAADTLTPVTDVLSAMPATGQWYADNNGALTPDTVAEMTARRWLAEGLALAEQGDAPAAAEALEKAYNRRSPDGLADADVLIAMYRLDPPSPGYRDQVVDRIEELTEQLDKQVLAQPDEALWLNFWAWLVGNTVGDYDKAVRYSKRSLQLRPDEPGLLDTLARCYFARGDLELAVETQQRAVGLEPTAKVMQRQLVEFENALAEQNL